MGNVESITGLTRLMQDVQYSTALKAMSPEQRDAYFRSQKEQLLDTILTEREGTFVKMYADAEKNNDIQTSLLFYQQRNKDLQDVGDVFNNQNKSAISTAKFNNDLATRQYQVNEWSYNNKMDTLFVFQLLFVSLVVSALFVYLSSIGLFAKPLLGFMVGLLLVGVVLVLVARAIYTSRIRDQRFWNRRQFNKKAVPQGSGPGSICPPAEGFADSKPAPLNSDNL